MLKVYDKRHDRRIKDRAIDLPEKDHRVRCEISLRRGFLKRMSIHDVADLVCFPFRRIRSSMQFRLLTVDVPSVADSLAASVDFARAEIAFDELRRGGFAASGIYDNHRNKRCAGGRSIAFPELNERVGKTLSRLRL